MDLKECIDVLKMLSSFAFVDDSVKEREALQTAISFLQSVLKCEGMPQKRIIGKSFFKIEHGHIEGDKYYINGNLVSKIMYEEQFEREGYDALKTMVFNEACDLWQTYLAKMLDVERIKKIIDSVGTFDGHEFNSDEIAAAIIKWQKGEK